MFANSFFNMVRYTLPGNYFEKVVDNLQNYLSQTKKEEKHSYFLGNLPIISNETFKGFGIYVNKIFGGVDIPERIGAGMINDKGKLEIVVHDSFSRTSLSSPSEISKVIERQ